MPNDDMGQGVMGVDPEGKSITDQTFEVSAKSQGMTKKQAQEETLKLLKKVLGEEK